MTDAAPVPAPIIVSALFAPAEQAWLDGLRRAHFPPERNHIAAHLTLFHHLPPSLAPVLAQRLAGEARASPPSIDLAGVMNLGRGVALRMASPALAAIRARLANAFDDVLTPQDRAGWRPHVTVQNKVEPAVARALLDRLALDIPPRRMTIVALGSFYYRGGPWEPIGRYPFRG